MQHGNTRGKIVRRFGDNIFEIPKFDKLLARKQGMPRSGGRRPRRISEFGRQLAEKQKLKFAYGLTERQFHVLFQKAKRMRGVAGHNFLTLLERRIDNVVFQTGMAATRRQARQLVNHGHFLLNGSGMDIPSILVKVDDIITVKDNKSTAELIRKHLSQNSNHTVPNWLTVSADDLHVTVNTLPVREDVTIKIEEQLIVEYYSR